MKVLLAVDGSVYTEKMVSYLVTHQELIHGACSMTALAVLPEMPMRTRAALGQAEVDRHYKEDATAILEPVMASIKSFYPNTDPVWKVGPIGKTIAEFAEAGGYQLIVMGSHGQNALTSLVMGSVTTRVLARCEIPVLIIR